MPPKSPKSPKPKPESSKAFAATDKANKSGKLKDHRAAAKAHEKAASVTSGDTRSNHNNKRDEHRIAIDRLEPSDNNRVNSTASAVRPVVLLESVFTKYQLRLIGISTLFIAVLILAWCLYAPGHFDGTFVRVILAISLAIFCGLFLFIIYPWDYRLKKAPIIQLNMEIVGPAALIIVLVAFYLSVIPTSENRVFFEITDEKGHSISNFAHISDSAKITFTDDHNSKEYQWVTKPASSDLLGVLILFNENKSKRKAKIQIRNKEEDIVFDRNGDHQKKLKLE